VLAPPPGLPPGLAVHLVPSRCDGACERDGGGKPHPSQGGRRAAAAATYWGEEDALALYRRRLPACNVDVGGGSRRADFLGHMVERGITALPPLPLPLPPTLTLTPPLPLPLPLPLLLALALPLTLPLPLLLTLTLTLSLTLTLTLTLPLPLPRYYGPPTPRRYHDRRMHLHRPPGRAG
jgi:hypothetical protein